MKKILKLKIKSQESSKRFQVSSKKTKLLQEPRKFSCILWTHAILIVFKNLTRVHVIFQIALKFVLPLSI